MFACARVSNSRSATESIVFESGYHVAWRGYRTGLSVGAQRVGNGSARVLHLYQFANGIRCLGRGDAFLRFGNALASVTPRSSLSRSLSLLYGAVVVVIFVGGPQRGRIALKRQGCLCKPALIVVGIIHELPLAVEPHVALTHFALQCIVMHNGLGFARNGFGDGVQTLSAPCGGCGRRYSIGRSGGDGFAPRI